MQFMPISKCPGIAKPAYSASLLCLYSCMFVFVSLHINLSQLRKLLLDFPYLSSSALQMNSKVSGKYSKIKKHHLRKKLLSPPNQW